MSVRPMLVLAAFALAACSEGSGPTGLDSQPSAISLAKGSDSDNGSGGGSDDRIETRLAGSAAFPDADGKAKFRDRGGEQQLEIELEDGPPNTAVNYFVDGNKVGSAVTDGFGDAEIRLNSDEGDTVPAVGAGTSIAVRTAAGTLIVSGSF